MDENEDDMPKTFGQKAKDRILDKSIDWVVVGLIGGLVFWVFDPVRDWVVGAVTLPASFAEYVAQNGEALTLIRDDIEALRRPSEIFEVARSSGPTEGYCVTGEHCEILMVIRRTPQGVRCKIVPGATGYAFFSPDLTRRIDVTRVDEKPSRNIGIDWTELPIVIRTPRNITGDAFFVIVPIYTQCLGEDDVKTVSEESQLVSVPIIGAARTAPSEQENTE